MRHLNVFAGLAILTMSVTTLNAQIMFHPGGSSGNQTSTASNHSSGQAAPAMPHSAPHGGAPQSAPAGSSTNFSSRPIAIIATPNRDHGFRDRDGDGDRDRVRQRGRIIAVAPVGGYIYSSDDYSNPDDNQQQPQQQYVEPEAPAPTIFESRPGYTAPPVRAYQSTFQAPDPQSDGGVQRISAVEPQASTILVFRDGHMIEIGNYVIVHDALYNLTGDSRTHKIMLADLDLDKTIKINQERGSDFKLPKS